MQEALDKGVRGGGAGADELEFCGRGRGLVEGGWEVFRRFLGGREGRGYRVRLGCRLPRGRRYG